MPGPDTDGTLWPVWLVIALLAVAACSPTSNRASGADYRGFPYDEPIPRPDFTLTDTDGNPYSFSRETRGRLALLFFGYTHCPDICPIHLANIGHVLRELPIEQRNRVTVVFVTTDPKRDTAERIREWLDRFDRSFVGLRGRIEDVERIQVDMGVPPAIREPPDEAGSYAVLHAAAVMAFSPDGPARLRYPFGIRQADWAHDLPKLLGEPGS